MMSFITIDIGGEVMGILFVKKIKKILKSISLNIGTKVIKAVVFNKTISKVQKIIF